MKKRLKIGMVLLQKKYGGRTFFSILIFFCINHPDCLYNSLKVISNKLVISDSRVMSQNIQLL
jgi:hypothetical protein